MNELSAAKGGPRPSLDALTGLRFFAALHVVAFHYAEHATAGVPALHHLVHMGDVGVSLFFVLSGFVLAYSYTDGDGGLRGDRRSFWVARLARIYPLFVVALLLAAPGYVGQCVERGGLGPGLARAGILLVPALLLLQAWTPLTAMAWNGPGWSLSAEAFFYLAFPWAVARVRCPTRRRLVAAGAIAFLAANAGPVALFALGRAVRLDAITIHLPGGALDGALFGGRVVTFNPLLRLPEFVFGVYLGKYFLARPAPADGRAGAALAVGSAITLVAILCAVGGVAGSFGLVQTSLYLPLFSALVLGLARGGGPLGRALSTPPLRRLGEASYAVYILQAPFFDLYARVALTPAARAARSPGPLSFCLFAGLLVGASLLAHQFIEVPARDRLKRLLLPRRPRPAAPLEGGVPRGAGGV